MVSKLYNKKKIKASIESYISHAKEEYNAYKKEKDTTKLKEAGEKLWAAFNDLMELKADKNLNTAKEVRDAVYATQDNVLISLYNEAFSLHQFFYGWTDRIEDIEERFKSIVSGLDIYSNREDQPFLLQNKKGKIIKV